MVVEDNEGRGRRPSCGGRVLARKARLGLPPSNIIIIIIISSNLIINIIPRLSAFFYIKLDFLGF